MSRCAWWLIHTTCLHYKFHSQWWHQRAPLCLRYLLSMRSSPTSHPACHHSLSLCFSVRLINTLNLSLLHLFTWTELNSCLHLHSFLHTSSSASVARPLRETQRGEGQDLLLHPFPHRWLITLYPNQAPPTAPFRVATASEQSVRLNTN